MEILHIGTWRRKSRFHNDRPKRSFRICLKRQVNEAVRISSSQADILLNSKSEFHQAPLTRLVAFMGLHGDQGEDQAGQAFPGGGRAGAVGRARAGRRDERE